jgi:hypothetical protein
VHMSCSYCHLSSVSFKNYVMYEFNLCCMNYVIYMLCGLRTISCTNCGLYEPCLLRTMSCMICVFYIMSCNMSYVHMS